MEQSDGEIVGRVVDGEVEAFRVLVERYYERCHRYATRLLGDCHDADDVVQSTFLRAYRALGGYSDDGRFDRWIFRILINCCRSRLARCAREETGLKRLRVERRGRADTQAPAGDFHLVERIRRALDDLSPRLREAFLLHHVEDLSYPEMADLTGLSVSALKMRVHRAREQLRATLETTDEDE